MTAANQWSTVVRGAGWPAGGALVKGATLTEVGSGVRCVHRHYHIPISNTATAVMALEALA